MNDNINQANKTEQIGFVYRWVNQLNGNWYIGSHAGTIEDGYIGSGPTFKKAVLKNGIENFKREILFEGKDFRKKEEEFLTEFDAQKSKKSYNLKNEAFGATLPGNLNGMYSKKHTEENKQKISKIVKLRYTDERKNEHSILMTGKGNPIYGKPRSEFTKQKIINSKRMNRENWGFLKTAKHHKTIFYNIYARLGKYGKEISPRGQKTLEIENFSVIIPPYVRFCNFENRKLNIDYIKTEFLWYLKGNKCDLSITEHAKLWNSFIDEGGIIHSNYGQYIFGELNQFDYVVNELSKDKDSRRAVIIILQPYHTQKDKLIDVPCTYGLSFRIRNNKLNMTVKMRSQDSYFGLASDVPIFSIIHEMLLNVLRTTYPNLEYGEYYHFVESFHIYEKHFKFIEDLKKTNCYSLVLCPQISGHEEVIFIRNQKFETIPDKFQFTRWLLKKDNA